MYCHTKTYFYTRKGRHVANGEKQIGIVLETNKQMQNTLFSNITSGSVALLLVAGPWRLFCHCRWNASKRYMVRSQQGCKKDIIQYSNAMQERKRKKNVNAIQLKCESEPK